MTYVSKPMGHRLGIFADKIENKREALGLDEKGFKKARTVSANAADEDTGSEPLRDD
jgi:hypothetical protein